MTPTPDPTAVDEHALAIAERDVAAAEHRQLRMETAVARLAPAAGADPARLLDSMTFADEFRDLGRDPSDADVTAAIERTVATTPAVRPLPATPAGRPPRAGGSQGSAETTARTITDRRAAEATDQSPAGRIARELRRVDDRKNGRHR